MEMQDLLQHFRLMAEQIGAKSVYGEPVVHGDKTIVPVASVAFGLAGDSVRTTTGVAKAGVAAADFVEYQQVI